MGHQVSKSSVESRVVFQRVGTEAMSNKMDEPSSPASVRIQKKVVSQSASPSSSSRALALEKCWSPCRGDAGGLEYVMDNPTGGVWVKSKERWTRS